MRLPQGNSDRGIGFEPLLLAGLLDLCFLSFYLRMPMRIVVLRRLIVKIIIIFPLAADGL